MLLEMMLAATLFSQEARPEDSIEAERAPRHWTAVPWAKMPLPEPPFGARGVLQAEVTCVAVERNRLASCHLERQFPANSRFGRNVLRSMRAARTLGDRMRPGDTATFAIWLCVESAAEGDCRMLPWPGEH